MSIYYSPQLARLLMDERLREARQANYLCCEEIRPATPGRSIRDLFRRQSPTICEC